MNTNNVLVGFLNVAKATHPQPWTLRTIADLTAVLDKNNKIIAAYKDDIPAAETLILLGKIHADQDNR